MANKQKAWRTRAGRTVDGLTSRQARLGRVGKKLRDNFTKFVPVPSFLVQLLLIRGGWAYQQEVQNG